MMLFYLSFISAGTEMVGCIGMVEGRAMCKNVKI